MKENKMKNYGKSRNEKQRETWQLRWLWTFASTRKMKTERARRSQSWGWGGRALLRPHGWLRLALSLFIFLVDAKVHSHLNCHVSHCFRLFFLPDVFKNLPPDWFWGHFLYHSGSIWGVCFTGFTQIVREGRNLKKVGKKIFWKIQIWDQLRTTLAYMFVPCFAS